MASGPDELDECPHCGELIPRKATFCPHCGSDAETGWNPDGESEALDLPQQSDSPAEGSRRLEAGTPGPNPLVWALILVAFMALLSVSRLVYPRVFLPFFCLLVLTCLVLVMRSRRR